MSRIYDNWERLVEAVLKREDLRQIALRESLSSSISADLSSRFSFSSFLEDFFDLFCSNEDACDKHPGFLKVYLPSRFKGSRISSDIINQGGPSSASSISYHEQKHIEFEEIKKATKNFQPDGIIGKGGFGMVFKGWIDEHTLTASKPGSGMPVAIKRWSKHSIQGRPEWMSEIHFLTKLHHPNLVKLIGFCRKDWEMILVYEFMPKGSLDNLLFRRGYQSLPWKIRIKVAIGAARGLSFLHDREIPVIHGCFKSGDILLDGEFNVKLSDFGLARDGPTANISTRDMGTCGYAAPEYVATGLGSEILLHCSYKKRTFTSAAIFILSLLVNSFPRQRVLLKWVKPYMCDKRKLPRMMDAALEGQYPLEAAYIVAALALLCLSTEPKRRPPMTEVLVALEKLQD